MLPRIKTSRDINYSTRNQSHRDRLELNSRKNKTFVNCVEAIGRSITLVKESCQRAQTCKTISKDIRQKESGILDKTPREEKVQRIHSMKGKIFQHSRIKNLIIQSRPNPISSKDKTNKNSMVSIKNSKQNQQNHQPLNLSISPGGLKESTVRFKQNIESQTSLLYIDESNSKSLRFIDTAIQTDAEQVCQEFYEQYIRFRKTQKQKFSKLNHLFQYIDKFIGPKQQKLWKNFKELTGIFQQASYHDQEKRIRFLMQKLTKNQYTLHEFFNQTLLKSKAIIYDLQKDQIQFQSLNTELLKFSEHKVVKTILQKEKEKPKINPKDIKQIYDDIYARHKIILDHNSHNLNEKIKFLSTNFLDLEEKYASWLKYSTEQSSLIKNCVFDILQLPEITMSLFGFNEDDKENDGFLKMSSKKEAKQSIFKMTDIQAKKCNPSEFETHNFLMKCCETNCLNCVYMQTKIKCISEKNRELKPVVKILMNLVEGQNSIGQFQKRLQKMIYPNNDQRVF